MKDFGNRPPPYDFDAHCYPPTPPMPAPAITRSALPLPQAAPRITLRPPTQRQKVLRLVWAYCFLLVIFLSVASWLGKEGGERRAVCNMGANCPPESGDDSRGEGRRLSEHSRAAQDACRFGTGRRCS